MGSWTFVANDATALNQGSNKTSEENLFYMNDIYPHSANNNDRRWGPSSLHPGVVLHGYGDGHSGPIQEGVDGDTYLHLITRNGREPINEEDL